MVTAKSGADIDKLLSDVRNKVSAISMPSDAHEPNITSIETDNNRLFSLYLYQKNGDATKSELLSRASVIKNRIE